MLNPPEFLFITMNNQCNFKCNHCDYWKSKKVENIITDENRIQIINEFHEMNNLGKVVICGGESTLDPDTYFLLSKTCRELGLSCFSVINGTSIKNTEDAEYMLLNGPSEITVSLDSPNEIENDIWRGFEGAYKIAIQAVQFLIEARKKLKCKTKIYVMGLISELNYRDLDKFYNFVLNDLHADKLKLNFLQPTFGSMDWINPYKEGTLFEKNRIRDVTKCISIIKQCEKKYNLNFNPKWLDVVQGYLEDVCSSKLQTTNHICNSTDRNIMVDLQGKMGLCFSMPSLRPNIWRSFGDLKGFWEGSSKSRNIMNGCNKLCGISHSVKKESASLRN